MVFLTVDWPLMYSIVSLDNILIFIHCENGFPKLYTYELDASICSLEYFKSMSMIVNSVKCGAHTSNTRGRREKGTG